MSKREAVPTEKTGFWSWLFPCRSLRAELAVLTERIEKQTDVLEIVSNQVQELIDSQRRVVGIGAKFDPATPRTTEEPKAL